MMTPKTIHMRIFISFHHMSFLTRLAPRRNPWALMARLSVLFSIESNRSPLSATLLMLSLMIPTVSSICYKLLVNFSSQSQSHKSSTYCLDGGSPGVGLLACSLIRNVWVVWNGGRHDSRVLIKKFGGFPTPCSGNEKWPLSCVCIWLYLTVRSRSWLPSNMRSDEIYPMRKSTNTQILSVECLAIIFYFCCNWHLDLAWTARFTCSQSHKPSH